jgi:hypothetical protein
MSKLSWVMVCVITYKNLKPIINLNQIKMKFTSRIKAEEFAISQSNKRWNTYFHILENDDNYTVDRYWATNSISFALKGKLTLDWRSFKFKKSLRPSDNNIT